MTNGTIDSAVRAIVQLGFSIVVAGVLLWFILGRLTSDLDRIASRMDSQVTEMKAHTQELREQTHLMKDFIRQKGGH